MSGNHYIIDSCSLIDLQRFYPIDVFPSVWEKMHELAKRGLIHIPNEVYNEVKIGDDNVPIWIDDHKFIIVSITQKQLNLVKEIVEKYPSIVNSINQYNADPWLIAVAFEFMTSPQQKLHDFLDLPETEKSEVEIIIVTEESLRGNKIKIPFICQEYSIKCIKILDLIKLEGWKF